MAPEIRSATRRAIKLAMAAHQDFINRGQLRPPALIALIRNTPTKRAKPRSRESWRCRFWSAPTGARRRFDSSKESVWDSTSARYNLFEAGSSFRRATLRATPCPLGSLWKPSFAFSRQSFNNGEAFFTVSYEFTPWEQEPTPQVSSARGGRPPRKLTGIGVLDPPGPTKRPPGPIPVAPTSLFWRIAAALLLVGLAVMTIFLLYGLH